MHFFNDVFDENTSNENNNDKTPTAFKVLNFSFVLSLFLFRAVDGEFKVKALLSSYIKQCI